MPRGEKVLGGLLIIITLLACFFPCQGCWWGKPREGPSLVAPALIKVNIIEEDKLKRQLRIVHPVIPEGKQSRYQVYVTPHDPAVEALAGQVDGVQDAYREAVQWIWVSDQTLHGESEKWLMPHEFLAATPNYPSNPSKGDVVSDCEEQANTLVSVLRAEAVSAAEVRAVIGKVKFGDGEGGHAWVELWQNGEWLPLEATSGPYWDDDEGELVTRRGTPFNYYATHSYDVIEVWGYYNDIYYLDPRTGTGNAPASWQA